MQQIGKTCCNYFFNLIIYNNNAMSLDKKGGFIMKSRLHLNYDELLLIYK